MLLVNNFLQKSQPPQGGFLIVITFLSCCITHPSFLPPPSHCLPLPYHASSNLQNGNHLRHQNYCWMWIGDESQVPCSACLWDSSCTVFCISLIKMSCLKNYTAWRIEETTERRGEEKAGPSCYCSCLPIKKIQERFPTDSNHSHLDSALHMNNALMSAQKRPKFLASEGRFTVCVYIWH